MNKTPLVSVVISYYNDEKFIKDAVESVLGQTYCNWELILINHSSTDNCRAIVRSFEDARLKHLDMEMNMGATGNFVVQKALEVARGEYIKLLSADDILLPHALSALVAAAQNAPEADLIFGDVEFVDADKKPFGETWFLNRFPARMSEEEYLQYFLRGVSVLPYPGNLIKTSALKTIPMDCVSVLVADMGLWVELLLKGGRLAFTTQPVVLYRMHDAQMCSVAREEIIQRRVGFESMQFIRHFLQAKLSVEFTQKILPQDSFARSLTADEAEWTPFVIARYLAAHGVSPSHRLAANAALADMLQEPARRERIQKRFGWGIKQFRQLLTEQPIFIYESDKGNIKNLPLKIVAYYFFRKLYYVLSLRTWRHARRRKKERIL